jgi:hypothetical protein
MIFSQFFNFPSWTQCFPPRFLVDWIKTSIYR